MKWSNSAPLFSTKERSWGHGSYLPCIYLRVKIILGSGTWILDRIQEFFKRGSLSEGHGSWEWLLQGELSHCYTKLEAKPPALNSYLQLLYCYTKFSVCRSSALRLLSFNKYMMHQFIRFLQIYPQLTFFI